MTTAEQTADPATVTDAPPTPEPIMRLAAGFMAAKHLFAANELGVFEALADSPATLDALAARIGLTRRAARIIADAMVALGMLDRRGDTYQNGTAAAHFLAGTTPADLRPLLRFWDSISYPAWQGLAEALGSGPSRQVFDLDDAQQEIVSAGIEAVLAGPAHALAAVVDFSAHRSLLDVGGGTGSWSIAAVRRHPSLQATVLDLPVTADIARRRIADAGLTDQISVHAGDAMIDELPTGHDVFLVANLVHYWAPKDNVPCFAGSVTQQIHVAASSLPTSGPIPPTLCLSTPRSWPASSPCTCATATSTASTRSASGYRMRAGAS